jgi:hypothetical protein
MYCHVPAPLYMWRLIRESYVNKNISFFAQIWNVDDFKQSIWYFNNNSAMYIHKLENNY